MHGTTPRQWVASWHDSGHLHGSPRRPSANYREHMRTPPSPMPLTPLQYADITAPRSTPDDPGLQGIAGPVLEASPMARILVHCSTCLVCLADLPSTISYDAHPAVVDCRRSISLGDTLRAATAPQGGRLCKTVLRHAPVPPVRLNAIAGPKVPRHHLGLRATAGRNNDCTGARWNRQQMHRCSRPLSHYSTAI